MSKLNFFENLPSFTDFFDVFREENFKRVPDSWFVVLTDIKGSTKAIAEGRYKEVNTIGAASIVVAREAMEGEDIPYVFGGDGATLLVPPHKIEQIISSLSSLTTLSNSNFGLDLRVGACTVRELHERGKVVEVARYELVNGKSIAFFRGNGVTLAEKLIKSQPEKYDVTISTKDVPDLKKLSCRWQPLASRRGKVLSILIQSRAGNSVYENVLKDLIEIFPEGLDNVNPAYTDDGEYRGWRDLLKEERKLCKSSFSISYLLRVLEITLAIAIFKLHLVPQSLFKSSKYQSSMRSHSDYRKFDDVLRMVIDCSDEESLQVRKLLSRYSQSDDIFFGIFESDSSLMTCYVMEGLSDGQHIHFIDGNNGGYALAAVELKQQIKDAEQNLKEKKLVG